MRVRITAVHSRDTSYSGGHSRFLGMVGDYLRDVHYEPFREGENQWYRGKVVFRDGSAPFYFFGFQYEAVTDQVSLPQQEDPMNIGRTAIMLLEDGKAIKLRIDPVDQAQVAAAIKSAAEDGYTLIESAFDVGGLPARIAVCKQHTLAAVRIQSLNISTHFQVIGDKLVPVFAESADSIRTTCVWSVPSSMKLYVACKIVKSTSGATTKKTEESYLFAQNGEAAKGFFRLPLPNVFQDGRICMGRGWVALDNTIEGVLKVTLRQLQEAPWNTDLMPDVTKIRAMFSFDPSSKTNIQPIAGNWWDHCVRINRTEMEALYG